MSEIRDISLAPAGERKIRWVEDHMPVLKSICGDFEKTQPFKGLKVAVSVHLEAKTGYLACVFKAGGAEVYATGSNVLSTQDDIAAALVELGGRGERPAAALVLFDGELRIGHGGYLREMGNTDDLMSSRKLFKLL